MIAGNRLNALPSARESCARRSKSKSTVPAAPSEERVPPAGTYVVIVDAVGEFRTQLVAQLTASSASSGQTIVAAFTGKLPTMDDKPEWKERERRLYVAGALEIELKVPAPNLETALAAFQEEGWPEWIADPFSGDEVVPSQRLRDTVRGLNRCRQVKRIVFSSDGRAMGIRCRRT